MVAGSEIRAWQPLPSWSLQCQRDDAQTHPVELTPELIKAGQHLVGFGPNWIDSGPKTWPNSAEIAPHSVELPPLVLAMGRYCLTLQIRSRTIYSKKTTVLVLRRASAAHLPYTSRSCAAHSEVCVFQYDAPVPAGGLPPN